MAQVTKWERYEIEKKKIIEQNLTPEEYERAIAVLSRRLGL